MWKLTFNLCAVLFVTLMLAGRDRMRPEAKDIATAANAQNPKSQLGTLATASPLRGAVARVTSTEAEAAPTFWQVRGTRINVRGGPATSTEVLAKLGKGEEVLIVEENGEGWSKIRIEGDGIEGWVASSLLVPSE
jgi:SH3-like domain-containing protein